MDKRKLIFNTGLHKNLQPVSQSLERTSSNCSIMSDKQTNFHATKIAMQEKVDLFCDGKLSNIGSSKSLNRQSVVKNKSFVENKEINFCETEEDVSKKENFIVDNKLLKTKPLISKQLNSQILQNTSATSQQDNDDHLSGINRPLDTVNYSVRRKRKVACSPEEASESDLDFSYNEHTAIKKKRNEIILDRNLEHDAHDVNLNDSSGKRFSLGSKSSITESTSQKKQNRCEESLSPTKLKKYKLNKNSEQYRINNEEYLSKKQNFYIPPIFSNFLQKCSITISNDSTYVLSKFLILLYLTFIFY